MLRLGGCVLSPQHHGMEKGWTESTRWLLLAIIVTNIAGLVIMVGLLHIRPLTEIRSHISVLFVSSFSRPITFPDRNLTIHRYLCTYTVVLLITVLVLHAGPGIIYTILTRLPMTCPLFTSCVLGYSSPKRQTVRPCSYIVIRADTSDRYPLRLRVVSILPSECWLL